MTAASFDDNKVVPQPEVELDEQQVQQIKCGEGYDLDGCEQQQIIPLKLQSAPPQNATIKLPPEQYQQHLHTNPVQEEEELEEVEREQISQQSVQTRSPSEQKQPETEDEIIGEEEMSLADIAALLGRSLFSEDEYEISIPPIQPQPEQEQETIVFFSKNVPPEEQQKKLQQEKQKNHNSDNNNNDNNDDSGRVDLQRILTPIIASIAVLIIIIFICFTAKTIATK
eukprot:TRINITY_DN12042_c1_g1_i1.p1 TRINITY_DN12042_c1_g1~~TRINITY_DN12042_c1_g1_i1.p1  ORF type:complete len:256 (+),score=40.84 TRINITY_DN12042_c1_g1_i1:93-770(+)